MNRGYALELVNPIGRRYRPAPQPDDPLLREARELARRDEEWSPGERMARFDTLRTQLRLQQEYDLARYPAELEAPASWPSAIVELGVEALLAALAQRAGPRGAISSGPW